MKILRIKSPIFATRSIGISQEELTEEYIYIDIIYKKKDGKRLYPNRYRMKSTIVPIFPVQTVRGGVKLHIVPIKAMEVYNGS